MNDTPKVGVQIRPNHVRFATMRQAWIDADSAGVDTIWCFDHFYPIEGDGNGSSFECWTTLAAMSQVTENAAIGTLVTCYGYRNPDLLADMARTVDHASQGRLILGLGSGWLERDYLEYGFALPGAADRIRELDTALHRIRRRLDQLDPPPLGRIPILIGGLGARMTLAVCARHADIWNGWGDPSEIRKLNTILDRHCEDAGRDPAEISRTVALFEPATYDTYDNYVSAGADHLILVRNGPDYGIEDLAGLIGWRDARRSDS